MESPSKLLLGLEWVRAVGEYSVGHLMYSRLVKSAPPGDGHPVMILPGFGTSDASTEFMRKFICDIGYSCYPWGLGRNFGPRAGLDNMLAEIHRQAENIYSMHNRPLTLLGWSLGGVYAREVAKLQPSLFRHVVTLGTPFKKASAATNITFLYEIFSNDSSHRDPVILDRISTPPPVPFTSLYSRSDGVVSWQSSVEAPGDFVKNIEVPLASHLGLTHNPVTMSIVSNILTLSKENWTD